MLENCESAKISKVILKKSWYAKKIRYAENLKFFSKFQLYLKIIGILENKIYFKIPGVQNKLPGILKILGSFRSKVYLKISDFFQNF
jgi:hypothetical protein